MAGALPMILSFPAILLACGCAYSTNRPPCCSVKNYSMISSGLCTLLSSPAPKESKYGDLTDFFNNVRSVSTDNDDSTLVDIWNSSCAALQDGACPNTCSSSDGLQQAASKVTISVNCDVRDNSDNNNGLSVEVRLYDYNKFDLYDVQIMGNIEGPAMPKIDYILKCDNLAQFHKRTSSTGMSNIATVTEEPRIFTQVVVETTMSSPLTKHTGENAVSTPFLQVTAETKVSVPLTQVTGESTVSAPLTTVTGETTASTASEMSLKTTPYLGVYTPHSKVSTVHPTETTESSLPARSSEVTSDSRESTEYSLGATVSETMLTPSSTKEHGLCACRCNEAARQTTRKDVQQEVTQTAKELVVPRTTLAKQIRKTSSAPDQRLSSAVVGIICIIAMSSIFVVIVVNDLCRLVRYLVKTKTKTAG